MTRLAAVRCVILLFVSACATGGAHTQHAPSAAAPDVPRELPALRPPSELPVDFMLRQRVTAVWPGRTQSFDAVLQKRGDELLLVGLSPIGQPGFVLRLRDGRPLEVQNHTGQPLPFPPEFILADVQRVFFPWLAAPPPGLTGEREGQRDGVRIVEQLRAGMLEHRSFTRADQKASIEIQYEGGRGAQDIAQRVVLDNGWYRYRLIIETIEQTPLAD